MMMIMMLIILIVMLIRLKLENLVELQQLMHADAAIRLFLIQKKMLIMMIMMLIRANYL
jgi:hypothetical protein